MERDYTYIDDLVNAIILLIEAIPEKISVIKEREWDNLSSVAPYRVINIGNSKPVKLIHFIEAIEKATGKKAKKKEARCVTPGFLLFDHEDRTATTSR